jgi:hypothetical protein
MIMLNGSRFEAVPGERTSSLIHCFSDCTDWWWWWWWFVWVCEWVSESVCVCVCVGGREGGSQKSIMRGEKMERHFSKAVGISSNRFSHCIHTNVSYARNRKSKFLCFLSVYWTTAACNQLIRFSETQGRVLTSRGNWVERNSEWRSREYSDRL